MPPSEMNVTRGEFGMLVQQVSENARRLDSIDTTGTRGVGILQQQITDLAKDVAGLSTRLDQHDREHEQERRDRIAGRRWLISMAIALIVSIDGPVLALVLTRH